MATILNNRKPVRIATQQYDLEQDCQYGPVAKLGNGTGEGLQHSRFMSRLPGKRQFCLMAMGQTPNAPGTIQSAHKGFL